MSLRNIFKTEFPICSFIQVVTVLSLALIVIWRCLIPRSPTAAVTDIFILPSPHQNSTVQHEAPFCNTSLSFKLEIRNPNKGFGIYYDSGSLILVYRNLVIGRNTVPAFYQGHKRVNLLEIIINPDKKLCNGIPSGNTDLTMAVETKFVYEYPIFRRKSKHHQVSFEGHVILSPNGTTSGKNTELYKLRKGRS